MLFDSLDRRSLRGAAVVTVAPAAITITGYIVNYRAAESGHTAYADGLPVTVSVSPQYEQGSATYNPDLGHPVPTYAGGSISF